MPRFEWRPSKPHTMLFVAGALALLIFGITQMIRAGEFHWFFVVWVLIGLAIIGMALMQGFGRWRGPAMFTTEGETEREAEPLSLRLARNKPLAVIGAVVGAGFIGYTAIRMADGRPIGSVVFFALFGLGIIGFNLWRAFGRRGAGYTVTRQD